MPVKGSSLKHGPRKNLIDLKLWKEYVKSSGNEISYTDFKNIIVKSNERVKEKILDNINGFKLSESLGYVAVKRYKPKPGTKSIDYKKSKDNGCLVYHTNFHSFGYKARIIWYTHELSTCKHINLYKFIPERTFQRDLGKKVFAGKIYNEFGYDYFKQRRIRIHLNRLHE